MASLWKSLPSNSNYPLRLGFCDPKIQFSKLSPHTLNMLRILCFIAVSGLAAVCSADPQVALAGAMPAKSTCVAIKVSNGAQNGERPGYDSRVVTSTSPLLSSLFPRAGTR